VALALPVLEAPSYRATQRSGGTGSASVGSSFLPCDPEIGWHWPCQCWKLPLTVRPRDRVALALPVLEAPSYHVTRRFNLNAASSAPARSDPRAPAVPYPSPSHHRVEHQWPKLPGYHPPPSNSHYPEIFGHRHLGSRLSRGPAKRFPSDQLQPVCLDTAVTTSAAESISSRISNSTDLRGPFCPN
jgi:hypothetical protein